MLARAARFVPLVVANRFSVKLLDLLRESLNEATRRRTGNRKRRTFYCARNAKGGQRAYDAKCFVGHQNCGLKDGIVLFWLPEGEEGAAGCEDLLNLFVAREVTHNGLVDSGRSLHGQGVHEHGRSGGHDEGWEISLFVSGRFVRVLRVCSLDLYSTWIRGRSEANGLKCARLSTNLR